MSFVCSFTLIPYEKKSLEYEPLNLETLHVISFGRFSLCVLTWDMTTTPAGIRSNNAPQCFVLEQKAILIPETRQLSAISCKKGVLGAGGCSSPFKTGLHLLKTHANTDIGALRRKEAVMK